MIVAIDFETANSDRTSVISVGIAFRKNNQVFSQEWLIKPPDNTEFKQVNISKHHITPDMVNDMPRFPFVWRQIEQIIGDNPIFIAHNAKSVEKSCLCSLFSYYNMGDFKCPIFCTCEMSEDKFPQLCNHGLNDMTRWFAIELDNHHNAEEDAKACLELFETLQCPEKCDCFFPKIRSYYKENYAFDCNENYAFLFQKDKSEKKKILKNHFVKLIDEIINTRDCSFADMNIAFSGGFDFEIPKEIGKSCFYEESPKIVELLIKSLGANFQKKEVNRKTDILILSPYYYELSTKKKDVSKKYKDACEIQEKGGKIKIIPWSEFLKLCLMPHFQ